MSTAPVMLITGASGGVGQQLTRFFAKKEVRLLLHAHRGIQDLQSLVDGLYFSHPPHLFQADLGELEAVQTLCEKAMAVHGSVEVLVNNAGVSSAAISWKLDPSEWNRVMSVNLTAPFLMSKELLPAMRKKGFGRIVNISSIVAQTGAVGTAAYAASKAGLFGLSASMARELAPKGITVNTVALGYMSKGMIEELSEEMKEDLLRAIPANRFGEVEQLGALIEYLMGPDADYMTGQVLNLNGGLYAG